MSSSNKTVGLLRFFAFAAALVSAPLVSGCAATTEGEEDDGDATLDDGPVAATEQELATCRDRSGEKGEIYSFGGGRFRVCWIKAYGPAGVADFKYYLRNASGRTRRLKIALDNIDDTDCYTVRNGELKFIRVAGFRFTGKPQGVKAC